jgi:hypothetical protein
MFQYFELQALERCSFRASRQYPPNLLAIATARDPPYPNSGPPQLGHQLILASRRHAPAPRLRCGISKISNTVCVVMRHMRTSVRQGIIAAHGGEADIPFTRHCRCANQEEAGHLLEGCL